MIIKADCNTFIVFDLDDTLYSEIDFLKSAFSAIAHGIAPGTSKSLFEEMVLIYLSDGNPFKYLIEKFPVKNLTIEKLLYLYRNHFPKISLREGVLEMLIKIREKSCKTGIITDGNSITQRNKIKALGLESYFDMILISEEFGASKPAFSLFESFMTLGNVMTYYYFGDNINKDFIAPKKLGWYCVGVVNSENIYSKDISDATNDLLPHFFIKNFTEIEII